MKTSKSIVLGSVLGLALMGAVSASASDNKYSDYRADMDATKGAASSGAPVAWQHQSKYDRDTAERSGTGGTAVTGMEHKTGPKNYQNNTTM